MDGVFGGLMALGGIVKHVFPGRKINRFVPLINFAAGTAFRLSQGNDVGVSLTLGAQDALMATGGHQALKNTPGLTRVRIRGQKL